MTVNKGHLAGAGTMITNLIRLAGVALIAASLGACGLARIPLEAPKEPIRIEATLVIKHEIVMVQSDLAR
jgi:hypothetical protein